MKDNHTPGEVKAKKPNGMWPELKCDQCPLWASRMSLALARVGGLTTANKMYKKKLKEQSDLLGEALGALEEIEKGEGAFALDQLEFASNCIKNMKSIAKAILAKRKGEK